MRVPTPPRELDYNLNVRITFLWTNLVYLLIYFQEKIDSQGKYYRYLNPFTTRLPESNF